MLGQKKTGFGGVESEPPAAWLGSRQQVHRPSDAGQGKFLRIAGDQAPLPEKKRVLCRRKRFKHMPKSESKK